MRFEVGEFGLEESRRHRRRELRCECGDVRCDWDWGWDGDCGCEREEHRRHRREEDREDRHHREEDREDRHCRSCICERIRRLEFNERVTLFLKSSSKIENVRFVCFKERECCAEFVKHHEGHDELFLVKCKDIEAIQIKSKH
ncbi:hypothetical protein D4T97_004230 [Siminovitchia acidinfaciens]|uniref:Uncharacterized protein n=1 Tax=Siminovitchia acidinfaciens TaxID=2321395 RepID=A0A429Y8Q9_9BACI|nr:hypothetical protein [Siminovitchia acidinfaciens]RST77684.1 hypothetical protein D4T97_004230 [Siminovitchia acidinfaciens]